jgi:hypothetical protein
VSMVEEFPVVFKIGESLLYNPVWVNYCDTILDGRSVYDETMGYWDRLSQTILMREYRGIIGYDGDIRFRTEADLLMFVLRFS